MRPPIAWPKPKSRAEARVLLEAFNNFPFILVLSAFNSYPLKQCPRASCGSTRLLVGDDNFHCYGCGLMSSGAAFAGGFLYDWTFDQIAEVLELGPLEVARG